MEVIQVDQLAKTFLVREKESGLRASVRSLVRPRSRQVHAVRGITFEVDEGERIAFIGPNGAGKSTTIKMLIGILHPTGGRAQVLGWIPWEDRQRLAYEIGSVFGQKSQLWYHLPAADSFDRLPLLRGWDLAQVMTLYGVVAFGFGGATVVCGNAFRVAQIITSGDLDYYLVLPADPLLHLLVSRMSLPAWGDLSFGLAMFLIAVPGRWRSLPLFLLLGLAAGLIIVAFGVLVGSLAFWVGNAENFAAQATNALISFSLYPADIFPGLVRVLLYVLIPSALIGSVPAGLLADFGWGRLAGLLGFTVAISLAARFVFARGMRRYESGNLVRVRG